MLGRAAVIACALVGAGCAYAGDDADPDASLADARVIADAALPDAPSGEGRIVYPVDQTHSPLTPGIVQNLRRIAAQGPAGKENVFAKVGDSITDSTAFFYCFAAGSVNLAGRDALQATIDLFKGGVAGTGNPFNRNSDAAESSKRADWAITGDPSPLDLELTQLEPRYAVVMFGTNDAAILSGGINTYAKSMRTIIDTLSARGVVPILSTVPPSNFDSDTDLWVPKYNAVVRALAQHFRLALVDYHRTMLPLPMRGLDDVGIHPSTYADGNCIFTEAGLMAGYPMRNLITLEALDRVRRVVSGNEAAPDAPMAQALVGTGTPADPVRIPSLPFSDVSDTSLAVSDGIDSYPGCAATQDESGPEVVYRFDATEAMTVRALALFDDPGNQVDVDIHILEGSADPTQCRARNNRTFTWDLTPGTWYFVVDTFVSAGTPQAGQYLFILMQE